MPTYIEAWNFKTNDWLRNSGMKKTYLDYGNYKKMYYKVVE